MGTQEKQVEKILQKENLQKTTFQNLESSLEFFGFSESVNTLVDSFCVRLGEGESASVFSLCFHRLHHIRMYLLFFFLCLSTTFYTESSPPELTGHSAFHLQDVAHWLA